jgi:hypothetical protein
VIERVAGAAEDACELGAHPAQGCDAQVDLVDLRGHANAQRLRRRARSSPGPQDVGDLGEREADRLGLLDRAQQPNGLLAVAALAARLAVRRRQQAAPLVVAQVSTFTPARCATSPTLTRRL